MKKQQITDSFYYVETKDQANRLIRTVVFRLGNGIYEAFSSYFPNGNIVGFSTSDNDKQVVILALKDLEKELKLEHNINTAEISMAT